MGHDHAHHVEENPKVNATAALIFVLIIIGLVAGLFNFVQSMSHSDDHHGHEVEAHHDDQHSWTKHNNLEYDATALAGGKAPQAQAAAPVVAPTNVTTTDSTAPSTPTPSKDSTTATR